MHINRNVVSTNTFTATQLISNSIIVQEIISETKNNTAKNIFAQEITTNELQVENIYIANDDNQLYLNGDIVIESLSVQQQFEVSNLLQQYNWQLVYHDDFQEEKSLIGWNVKERSFCKQNVKQNEDTNHFLGGYCVGSSQLNLEKTYSDLPRHKQIKILARIHFFDNWNGEYVQLFVDDKLIWQKSAESSHHDINICGDESGDPHFGIPIEVTAPHNLQNVNLRFVTNLEKNSCQASFAIDDIEIFVK
ncbi:hypothetical protein IMG5_158830 [Ichthyophthirius multifiliis]|uniref:Uncharacterized protein n=1 Tax=Ichthyophthirius multifiliis TaxID=5932 RepID=G0QZP9_ICHMU|nr:hypothetical protein IMG5_158830 [Ichthyophthirius multifiliis]EGR29305.1 hypothetical protein IMG5_158830 [Ichthyophthirius multifiliis]|eukprot:XP_004030541.1 hypothetical protein IMG5_158830 [Ichthyophthirius multifiliis]